MSSVVLIQGTFPRVHSRFDLFPYFLGLQLPPISPFIPFLQSERPIQQPEKLQRNFVDGNISKSLLCSICQEVFNDPQRLLCGHTFCHDCITQWFRQKTLCPICRTACQNGEMQSHLIAKKIIDDLQVKCEMPVCKWKGRSVELEAHMRKCKSKMPKEIIAIDEEEKDDEVATNIRPQNQQPNHIVLSEDGSGYSDIWPSGDGDNDDIQYISNNEEPSWLEDNFEESVEVDEEFMFTRRTNNERARPRNQSDVILIESEQEEDAKEEDDDDEVFIIEQSASAVTTPSQVQTEMRQRLRPAPRQYQADVENTNLVNRIKKHAIEKKKKTEKRSKPKKKKTTSKSKQRK